MNRSIVPGAAGPARMETHQIDRSDSRYPAVLTERLGAAAPAGVAAMGRVEIPRVDAVNASRPRARMTTGGMNHAHIGTD